MKIFQRYVVYNYIKNFLVIFLALEFFYIGIDLLTNYKDLPDSANLQLLYIVYILMDAINYILPISSVFAMIVTTFGMVKSNELVTLYSVGVTKNSVIKPMFMSSMLIIVLYVLLNFTSFTYSKEYSSNILKYSMISNNSSNLFLKDKNKYVFFKTLDPIKKRASDIKIFEVSDNDLNEVVSAKSGYFFENKWILKDVKVTTKPKISGISKIGLSENIYTKYETLENFKPKVIENVNKGEYTLSILDAIDALVFFNAQGINTDKIKTILYSQICFPLFAPLLVIVLFYQLPVSSRFFNFAFLSFVFIFITLLTWGILFLLSKLAYASVIIPEIAILLPILLLGFISLRFYTKKV
jgi:lipopolysaccharide export system permease protein